MLLTGLSGIRLVFDESSLVHRCEYTYLLKTITADSKSAARALGEFLAGEEEVIPSFAGPVLVEGQAIYAV